ncbi:MAG: hypothetical protein A3J71_08480 [Pseudomonadales bacterium RIFCSPHIGHO2_02_FULL_60_43]|nr:MAG: hypothetical protein A3J71_08480 [Pseudomonadales bacterium RIFCSPHIGHO2_02_FULL_60_43]
METLSIALSLWKLGLVSSEELIAWVDAQIQMSDNPDEVIVQLSLNGPETCLERPIYEFPIRPIELTFTEEFGLRVSMLDPHSEPEVSNFIKWATVKCMGEDLDDPIVIFCYQLEDIWTLEAQVAFLRNELPPLLSKSTSIVNSFYARVPGLKLKGERTT